MLNLSPISEITLYILVAIIAFYTLLLLYWQSNVLKGKAMSNPDGTVDDWHEQKLFYGIAFADIFLVIPLSAISIVLIFVNPPWGFFFYGLLSFFYIWANTMFTVTSLRFEKPKITLNWIITYPFGIIVGIANLVWIGLHFNIIYLI